MYNRLLTVITLLLTLAACGTFGNKDTQEPPRAPITVQPMSGDATPVVGSRLQNMSNKTMRYVTRQQLFHVGCTLQSEKHNEQRLTVAVAPPVVLIPNAITGQMQPVALGDEYQTKVYDSKTPPFDMTGCLAQASSTPWERFGKTLLTEFGVPLIKYGTGFLLGREAFDYLKGRDAALADIASNAKPTINGDNNRVITGDGNEYNEAGGIQTEPLTFAEAQIGSSNPDEGETPNMPVTDVSSCLATGGTPLDAEGRVIGIDPNAGEYFRCSDGMGGNL